MKYSVPFHSSQPVSWKLPLDELLSRSVQQGLFDVNLLYGEWEVQRKCPCMGGNRFKWLHIVLTYAIHYKIAELCTDNK